LTEVLRPDLADADGAEVTEYLLAAGLGPAIQTRPEDGGLRVECDQDEAVINAALDAFTPTAPRGEYRHVPPKIRDHLGHLRDYETAVRAGQSPTAAQTQHVIADIITYLRLTEDRL